MDLNLIYALLIALIPVFFAVIFARRYNVIHGLISFVVFSFLLIFCLSAFEKNIPADILKYLVGGEETGYSLIAFNSLLNGVITHYLSKAGLATVLAADYGKYVLLAIYLVVFILSQVIASVIRRHRVNGIKSLKRQVKRY